SQEAASAQVDRRIVAAAGARRRNRAAGDASAGIGECLAFEQRARPRAHGWRVRSRDARRRHAGRSAGQAGNRNRRQGQGCARAAAKPRELHLTRAHGAVFDVRKLKSIVVKQERPERAGPGESGATALPATVSKNTIAAANAPAPATDSSFDGLDFATWGAGH